MILLQVSTSHIHVIISTMVLIKSWLFPIRSLKRRYTRPHKIKWFCREKKSSETPYKLGKTTLQPKKNQKSIIILFALKIRTRLLVQLSLSRWIKCVYCYISFSMNYMQHMGKPKVPIYFEDGCLVLVWTLNWGPQDLWDRSSWKTGWRKTQACTCSGIGETITIRTNDVGQIQIQNSYKTSEGP